MASVNPELNQSLISLSKFKSTPFYNLIKKLLILCQIFCTAPILDSSKSRSSLRRLHYIWCSTILIYIFVTNYIQSSSVNPNLITIEKAFYLSEFLSNCIIATIIISTCNYHAEYYQSVPDKLLQLDNDLKRFCRDQNYKKSLYFIVHKELCYLVWFVGFFLLSCFVVDLWFSHFDVLVSFLSSGAYNIPNVLISLNLGQYWLGLRFICLLYRRLNETLNNLLNITMTSANESNMLVNVIFEEKQFLPLTRQAAWYKREYSSFTSKILSEYEVLDSIRAIYSELDSLMSKFVNAFGYVLLINFLGSFLNLSVEYFAIYKLFDRPSIDDYLLFTYKLLWLALHTGRIFFILLTNHAIIEEKCRTCFILNEMRPSSKEMEHGINRFLLQLMVRKHSAFACGIIDLDLLFLSSIAGALANYIIFLIQIDLGNESLIGGLNQTGHIKP